MKSLKPVPTVLMLSLFWAAFALASVSSSTIEIPLMCPLEKPDSLTDNTLIYGGISFRDSGKVVTFRELHELSTSYKVNEEDNRGGSLRFVIGIDQDGGGKVGRHVIAHIDTAQECGCKSGDEIYAWKNLHFAAYTGPAPSFADSTRETWESTGNLIRATKPSFEIAESLSRPPAPNMSYDEVLGALGDLADKPVLYVMLIGDGGWRDDYRETILVDNVKVNNFKQTARVFNERRQQ